MALESACRVGFGSEKAVWRVRRWGGPDCSPSYNGRMTAPDYPRFQLVSPYRPAGDQPQAIERLVAGFEGGLAAQTLLTTSGITRVVDRLERDRLVERRACPTDRRGAFAVITAEGLARLDEALPEHLELAERWLTSRLDAVELEALLRSLRTIRDGVRPDATAGA